MGNIDSFENKVLLITGGTGSFGRAVLQKFDFDHTKLLSVDEVVEKLLKLEYVKKELG